MKRNFDIFVSIASYKDTELINTINQIFNNANDPRSIRVVVFNQTDFESDEYKYDFGSNHVEMYSFDYRKTRGVSWIRSKIQELIDNEKYYLQIDAHMLFERDWDKKFVSYLQKCNSLKPVLTFYPSSYDLEKGKVQSNIIKNEIRGLNRYALSSLGISMNKQLCDLDNGDNLPIPGTTIAAGFLFAPIEYVKEVPYDYNLFWNYEETDQTLRGFTNGWDFFGSPECLVWHKYNTTGTLTHYKEVSGTMDRENFSNDYAEKKYFEKGFESKYPLGTLRTLEEFEILNNVNFKEKTHIKPEIKDILIVVPYRNREKHLEDFLIKTPKYFDGRGITYDIIIAELDQEGDWNAGLVCNSVINFRKKGSWKYLYIHHVDVYPIDGEWVYPKINEVLFNLGDYGSCIMNYNDFFKIGGYRNGFWGWGAEDNDLYYKAQLNGLKSIDVTTLNDYPVKFDIEYQKHERRFEAINYSNNNQLLKTKPNRNNDSVFDTNKYGKTHSLVKLSENIYKQNVKPLRISPKNTENKKLIMSYIKDINQIGIYPFIKSVSYYSPFNYDMVVIDASKKPNEHIISELKAFGFKVIKREETKHDNLFLDRLVAFDEYLKENPKYEKVLCLDFTDIYLQGNPFEILDGQPTDKLLLTSEGTIINDQTWNKTIINSVYGQTVLNSVGIYEVLNCGVMFFSPHVFTEFVSIVMKEYDTLSDGSKKMYGVDQAIILKLIYYSQSVKVNTLREETPLAIHLHTIIHDADKTRYKNVQIVRNKIVKNSNNVNFKIVHQYNRSQGMIKEVIEHFNNFYTSME